MIFLHVTNAFLFTERRSRMSCLETGLHDFRIVRSRDLAPSQDTAASTPAGFRPTSLHVGFRRVAGLWYLDDGDILCHPRLVAPYPDAFDAANAKIGAKPNRTAPKDQLELLKMRDSTALGDGMLTLGVAKGGCRCACNEITNVVQLYLDGPSNGLDKSEAYLGYMSG